jgi:hypothetical protein
MRRFWHTIPPSFLWLFVGTAGATATYWIKKQAWAAKLAEWKEKKDHMLERGRQKWDEKKEELKGRGGDKVSLRR